MKKLLQTCYNGLKMKAKQDNDNVDMIIHGNEDDLSSSDESDENID